MTHIPRDASNFHWFDMAEGWPMWKPASKQQPKPKPHATMLKTIFTLFLFLCTIPAFAQDSLHTAYITVTLQQANMMKPHRVQVFVYPGTDAERIVAYSYVLKDETGKPLVFDGYAGAFNYLHAQGYRYVSSFVITGIPHLLFERFR